MSMPHERTITCDKCGHRQAFVAWESLNATLNPDEKTKLLKGQLTRFACEKCGRSASVVYPLLYHDMERRVMVWLLPNCKEPDNMARPPAAMMTKDYRFRFVAGLNDLIEKVMIFDAALDDRVVEGLKLVLRARLQREQESPEGELRFGGAGKNAQGIDSMAFEHLTAGGSEWFDLPRTAYDEFAASLAPKLSAKSSGAEWCWIDQDFAKGLII